MIDYNTLDLDHNNGDTLNELRWETPGSYMGHDPVGSVVAASIHRDSGTLERSNYECIKRSLAAHTTIQCNYDDENPSAVYTFSASHWAVGWVEYLIVPATASLDVLNDVAEIHNALSDYPVLDESHFSELEHDESHDAWVQSSLSDKIELCVQFGLSMFAARRETIPETNCNEIEHYLLHG